MAIKVKNNVVADWDSKVSSPTQGSSVDITTIGNDNDQAVKLPRLIKKGSNWDISTATYSDKNLSVVSQGVTPSDLFFKPDGKILYTIGEGSDSISAWDLLTPWDISTAVFRERLYIGFHSPAPRGLYFRPDGHMMYIYDNTNQSIRRYNLDVAWSINSASFKDNNSNTVRRYYVGWQDTSPNGLFFKSDGTRLYVLGDTGDDLQEYQLHVAWDVTTADHLQNITYKTLQSSGGGTQIARPSGLCFGNNGTKVYIVNYTPSLVSEFTLSTAWDLSTMTYTREWDIPGSSLIDYIESIEWNSAGTRFFITGQNNDIVEEYSVASAWSVASPTLQNTISIADSFPSVGSLRFADDGNKVYFTGSTYDHIMCFRLQSPYDLSVMIFHSVMKIQLQETTPRSLFVKNDGTSVYTMGSSGDDVIQYVLSTPHDFSTCSGDILELWGTGNEYTGLFFKPDGTRLFVINSTGGSVEEWKCKEPWLIQGAEYIQQKGTISQRDPRGLWFRGDGNRLFITGEGGDYVDSYYLSTSWDISTMTYEQSFSIGDKEATPRGIAFKTDGSKFWFIGYTSDRVWEYDLTHSRLVFESNIDIASDAEIGGNLTVGKELIAQGRIDSGDVRTDYIKVENNLRFGKDGVINPAMDTDLAISQRIGEIGQFNANLQDTKVNDVWMKPDGTELYVLGGTNKRLYKYNLTTKYDINTREYDSYLDLYTLYGAKEPKGFWFNDTGTQVWIVDYQSFIVSKVTMSTAWDFTTASFNGNTPSASTNISAYITFPTGIFWKPDGTSYWITGSSTNAIKEFSVSTSWDISTSSYVRQFDTDTLIVAGGTGPYIPTISGLSFNSTGTRMYVSGQVADAVYEFELSTAWNITTATYNVGSRKQSGNIGGSIDGMWVKDNGTKLYTIDANILKEYSMSVAHDPSTASETQSYTFPSSLSACSGMFFSDDGTRLILIDSTTDSIVRYDLSTGFDFSTISHDGGTHDSYDISSKITAVEGMTVSYTGTELYITGNAAKDIVQYTMSAANDINTITYTRTLDISGDLPSGTLPRDVAISKTGDKMYVPYSLTPTTGILVYDLSTNFDISTATLSETIDKTAFDPYSKLGIADIRDIKFKSDDGSKLYILDINVDKVFQYDLRTAWDISADSLNYMSDSRSLVDGNGEGITFSPDGSMMFMTGNSLDTVAQYRLRTPWKISSMEYMKRRWIGGTVGSPKAIYLDPNGNFVWIAGSTIDSIIQFDMNTPFQLASMNIGNIFFTDEWETAALGLTFSPDGTHMYFSGTATDRWQQYDLDSAWDIKTAKNRSFNTSTSGDSTMDDIYISRDGSYAFHIDYTLDQINRYTLPTPWETWTMSSRQFHTVMSVGVDIQSFFVAGSGTKFYFIDATTDTITCCTASTAYDINSIDWGAEYYSAVTEADPQGVTFNSDGTKMYIVGSSGDEVNQYSLSTAYSVKTATHDGVYRIYTYETFPVSVSFKTDGTKMYILGSTSRSIYEFTLSTAWTITSGVTYVGRSYIGDLVNEPSGMEFRKDNGSKIYITDSLNKTIVEYNLTTPWAVASSGGIPQTDVFDLKDYDDLPTGIHLSSNGDKFYIVGDTDEDIYEFDMSADWDIKTASYNSVKYVLQIGSNKTQDIFFNDDGTICYVLEMGRNSLAQFVLSTAWDLSTISMQYVMNLSYTTMHSGVEGPTGVAFTNEGKILLISNSFNNTITAVEVPTAWDLRSIYPKTRSFFMDAVDPGAGSLEGSAGSIQFSNNGDKFFVIGKDSNTIREYDLSTPFDISTSVYNGNNLATTDGNSDGMHFSPCGYHLYTAGYDTDLLRHFILTSAWDITTASETETFSVSENDQPYGDNIPISVYVRPDGKKFYVNFDYSTKIIEYDMPNKFSFSGMTAKRYRSLADGGHLPRGFVFREDGTRLYCTEEERDTFLEYKLSTPWDISTLELHRKKRFPYGFYNPQSLTFTPDGKSVVFVTRFSEAATQLSITENYLSIEGSVSLNGSVTVSGNMITNKNVLNRGNYGFGTDTPQVSIDASGRKDGFVFPTGTTAERPTNVPIGTVRYNTTISKLEIYLGSGSWSEGISSTELKDSVSLQILNSSGAVVKTIYGAGS